MGIRQIRFCDVTGTEDDVEPHEIHIDQMRIEIDLAGLEYRRLLEALRPFIDAGRVEAAAPDTATLPARAELPPSRRRAGRAPTGTGLSATERVQLRQWAEAKGLPLPANNRFKQSLIAEWRQDTAPAAPESDVDVAE
ncbi:MAG: Lsr2 family protein [Pseudonocardia sp.]|nr:Lsr2 family protein [Pseudonocardia sp.]